MKVVTTSVLVGASKKASKEHPLSFFLRRSSIKTIRYSIVVSSGVMVFSIFLENLFRSKIFSIARNKSIFLT